MTTASIARRRLTNQCIDSVAFDYPGAVVHWMGMVQAQDYLGALWAVGLRLGRGSEATIERALVDRSIVRTWPARGTLHFVAASDVRWLLDILTPRVIARSAGRYRQLGLEEVDFDRARDLWSDVLQGGRQLAREDMYQVLEKGGISTAGQRGIHILGRLAQEGVLCFGTREGKQQRFALLDEWLPPAPTKPREEGLAELARRYFSSHGPATLPDFVWWSGLTMADARAGIEAARPHLLSEAIGGQTYWLSASTPPAALAPTATLLPAFDEYLVGYKDRSAVLDPLHAIRVNAGGGMLNPAILIDGQVVGVWKRALRKKAVVVTPTWFSPPDEAQEQGFAQAAQRYGAFLGLAVQIASDGSKP